MNLTKEDFKEIVKDISELIAKRVLVKYTYTSNLDREEASKINELIKSVSESAINEAIEPFITK